jgi:tetratricopeptide (TPR) repeat protein
MEDDFLSDEFVLDDVPEQGQGPTIVFAGPSDAPPALRAGPATAQRTVRGRGPYVLVAIGFWAGAAVAAITWTRPVASVRGIETMTVATRSPAGNPMAESSGSAAPSASDPANAAEQAAEQAKQAKDEAQGALEKGRAAQAIEAGERAVALDPTDAEAWLILGAAYQQQGAFARARRCFATCTQVATRGPRRECAALLR